MRIVRLEGKKLIGLRVVCAGDQYVNEIPKSTALLKERRAEIRGVLNPEQVVGAYVVGDCSPEKDGYWICYEADQLESIPDGMTSLVVPPQTYAVITHEGPNTEIKHTYEELHRRIASTGYERDLCAWHLELSRDGSPQTVELYDTLR